MSLTSKMNHMIDEQGFMYCISYKQYGERRIVQPVATREMCESHIKQHLTTRVFMLEGKELSREDKSHYTDMMILKIDLASGMPIERVDIVMGA